MQMNSTGKKAELDEDTKDEVRNALAYIDNAIVTIATRYVQVLEQAGIDVANVDNGLRALKASIYIIARDNDLLTYV